jgi:hypothetical protein
MEDDQNTIGPRNKRKPPLHIANKLMIFNADKYFFRILCNTFSINRIIKINNELRLHKLHKTYLIIQLKKYGFCYYK